MTAVSARTKLTLLILPALALILIFSRDPAPGSDIGPEPSPTASVSPSSPPVLPQGISSGPSPAAADRTQPRITLRPSSAGQPVPGEPPASQVVTEVEAVFGEFLAILDQASGQRAAVADALRIYQEALLRNAGLPDGDVLASARELEEQLARWLDEAQLAALEDYRQADARARFLVVQDPQVQLLAPGLNADNRALLLEVLYAEMPDPFMPADGVSPSLGEFLQQQQDAVLRTGQILGSAMAPSQMAQAQRYLDSMAQGLASARRLFAN